MGTLPFGFVRGNQLEIYVGAFGVITGVSPALAERYEVYYMGIPRSITRFAAPMPSSD
jgi:hypothetical protein